MTLHRAAALRSAARALLGLLALSGALDFPLGVERDTRRGRPLVEVLEQLRGQGLNLVFSTAVVGADLAVTVEPRATDPRAALDEILAPLGLEARDGPGGAILIVRAAPGATDGPAPPTHVEEIVVTPGRHSIVRQESASRLRMEDEDAILGPTIGGDVTRVIELLPGVAGPDNSAAFNVRGAGSRDVSLVLDGLELYEPFHLQSFQSPFSLIDSKIVDTIDFLGGGFPAEFGDRHGGFVELSTALPESVPRSRIELGTLNGRAYHAAPWSGGSWLVSARAWYPEAVRDTIELGDTGLNPHFEDVYFKVSWSTVPQTVISLHGLLAYDRLEFVEPGGGEHVEAVDKRGYVWVRALRSWTPSVFSETVLSAGRLERSREGFSEPEDEVIAVDDRRAVDFLGLKHDLSWELSGTQLLKAGFQVRPLQADYRYTLGPPDDPDAARTTRLDPSGTSVGVYVAHRAAVTEDLATELGVRWDRQTYTEDHQLSPRLNAVLRLGERSDLRLGLGRFYQSQRIHELALEDGETTFRRAELSRQADLAFRHRFASGLRLRIDAYYRTLRGVHPRYENLFNPAELFPETEADRVLVAPERARLRGVEFLLRADPSGPWYWWVSYTRSSAEDVIEGGSVPRSWDQPHAGKFLVAYRWDDRWSVSLSGTAHTGWPTTPVSGETTTLPDGSTRVDRVVGARNSERFSGYARLDAKVSRSWTLPRGRLRVDLEIVNLTDRNNVCCVDEFVLEPRPDGTVEVQRELHGWLGITPSFSVLWEF